MKVAFKPVVAVSEELGETVNHWGVPFVVHELKEGDASSRYLVANVDDEDGAAMVEAGRVSEWNDDAARAAVGAAARERPARRVRRVE